MPHIGNGSQNLRANWIHQDLFPWDGRLFKNEAGSLYGPPKGGGEDHVNLLLPKEIYLGDIIPESADLVHPFRGEQGVPPRRIVMPRGDKE